MARQRVRIGKGLRISLKADPDVLAKLIIQHIDLRSWYYKNKDKPGLEFDLSQIKDLDVVRAIRMIS